MQQTPELEDHTALPSEATIAEIAKLIVYDSQGRTPSFGSLIHDMKTIVVFIREVYLIYSYTLKV